MRQGPAAGRAGKASFDMRMHKSYPRQLMIPSDIEPTPRRRSLDDAFAPIPPVREGGDRATAIDPEPTFMAAPWIVAPAWTRTFAPAAESITEAI